MRSAACFVGKYLTPEGLCFSFSFRSPFENGSEGIFFLTEGGERLEFRGLASIQGVQTELAAICMPQWVGRGGKDKEYCHFCY